MNLEIVSSCWRYDRCLAYHLSAFMLEPPRTPAKVVIYYCEEDAPTVEILGTFAGVRPSTVEWDFRPMERNRLMRRAISRNDAAQKASGDWVIYTDVDYIYRGHVLDELAGELEARKSIELCFTKHVLQTSQAAGDELIREMEAATKLPRYLDLSRFVDGRLSRAIGGSQIVNRGLLKSVGYLPESRRYQKPSDHWRRTHEDRVFRDWIRTEHGATMVALETRGVARIRHSQRGREGDCRN